MVVTTLGVGVGRVAAVGCADAPCAGTAADASGPALANASADAADGDCGRTVPPQAAQRRTVIARRRGSLTLR